MLKKRKREATTLENSRNMIGDKLRFDVREAYKLLRTNLEYSLLDDTKCKIIGITSALHGEGKSTTSINIAYTFAQDGKKTLLVEADMRLPTFAKRLDIKPRPGLSDLLAGKCGQEDAVQPSGLLDNFFVITSGKIPPNPTELINSKQMGAALDVFAQKFDVIIVDLPPINIVADAAIMAKFLQGMIVVVRQNYCRNSDLDSAVRQLEFANAKILGFVLTGAEAGASGYKRYGKYSRYYKKYSYHNASHEYATAAAETETKNN